LTFVHHCASQCPCTLTQMPALLKCGGGAISCAAPANVTISLSENVCTLVRPCSTCDALYFLLTDTECNSPFPTLILQHDRGEDTALGVQGCQSPLIANEGQRFQTREVLLGTCNVRTNTNTPESVPNGGRCANGLSSCSRLDINSLSIMPIRTLQGLDVSTYFADSCDAGQLPITWLDVPVQDRNSLFCRVQQEWGTGTLQSYVRHGLRVYTPQPYVTFQSESPSPSVTPSSSPTPSVTLSSSPTLKASLLPALSQTPLVTTPVVALDLVSRAEFYAVSVAVLFLLAGLGVGVALLYHKLQAMQRLPPSQWGQKEPQAVEMVNVLRTR